LHTGAVGFGGILGGVFGRWGLVDRAVRGGWFEVRGGAGFGGGRFAGAGEGITGEVVVGEVAAGEIGAGEVIVEERWVGVVAGEGSGDEGSGLDVAEEGVGGAEAVADGEVVAADAGVEELGGGHLQVFEAVGDEAAVVLAGVAGGVLEAGVLFAPGVEAAARHADLCHGGGDGMAVVDELDDGFLGVGERGWGGLRRFVGAGAALGAPGGSPAAGFWGFGGAGALGGWLGFRFRFAFGAGSAGGDVDEFVCCSLHWCSPVAGGFGGDESPARIRVIVGMGIRKSAGVGGRKWR
jgi:hypothetical protein